MLAAPAPVSNPRHTSLAGLRSDARFPSIADYHAAYKAGTTTPTDVAKAVVEAIATHPPCAAVFIAHDPEHMLKQAAESTARWAAGTPLGPLDGGRQGRLVTQQRCLVTYAAALYVRCGLPAHTTRHVHSAIRGQGQHRRATLPHHRRHHLACCPVRALAHHTHPRIRTASSPRSRQVTQDAAFVARVKACGAVLIGKTAMHELGIGTTGLNVAWGTPKNPYSGEGKHRYTGASSSGSAAAVSLGLCPFAIGARPRW